MRIKGHLIELIVLFAWCAIQLAVLVAIDRNCDDRWKIPLCGCCIFVFLVVNFVAGRLFDE